MLEQFYRIREVAVLLSCSASTLRRYEKLGRIKPASRNAAGQRIYRQGDLEAIRAVLVPEQHEKGLI
jgi:DNA-binding transcriptional MerR regulator